MKGLIVATVTPFNDDGSLNLGMIPDYVSYLRREGADGFFINGTTGELSLLSYEEKLEIARKFLEVTPKETIVGIHENSVERAVQLAREVVNLGAYYIASLPPVYLRPSDKGIIEYYEALSKLGVPVIAYYYPARLGYTIRVEVFEKMAADGIITGMKFTTSNASEFVKYMTALKGANKDFIMLNGDDWLLLYGLSMGADGAVSGIANISPSLVKSLLTAVSNGDLKESRRGPSNNKRDVTRCGESRLPSRDKGGAQIQGRLRRPRQEAPGGEHGGRIPNVRNPEEVRAMIMMRVDVKSGDWNIPD